MQSKSNFFITAGPLLLVLFIDGMGLGLVIPILNGLIFDTHSTFLSAASYTPLMHNIIYGGVIGIFMLCWFFGAAVLGDLSDHIGRKKSLLICLAGAFFSYVVSAVSVSMHSLSLLLIGRVIAGITSGSQPIAQAAIVDISRQEHKARNIGFILLALSLGFILGPLLGGILSDKDIVSWFDFSTPFYFAALISLLNICLLLVLFKETFVSKSTTFAVNPYHAVKIFISAFQHEKVRNLSIIFFIFVFGWSSFYSFISIYLLNTFHYSPTDISLFMAVMGIGFAVGNGYLVNFLARLFPLRTSYIYSNIVAAGIVLLMVSLPYPALDWLLVAPLACAVSIAYASLLTVFSNQVDAQSQGWIMGITGSISSLVWAVNGITVGILAAFNAAYPLYVSAIGLFVAGVATFWVYTSTKN